MKRDLFFCLALVMCGAFSGCSTAAVHNKPIAKVQLRVVRADSEETAAQNGDAQNAVDGNPNTYWHTRWSDANPGLPHEIVIELMPPTVISGFTYLPRQDVSDHGTIKDFEFYVSNDGDDFGQPIKKGSFKPGKKEQIETFEPVKCRFIKLKALSEINGEPWTSAAEIRVLQNGENPVAKDYWQGDVGKQAGAVAATNPDAIDTFIAALKKTGGLWMNGIDAYPGPSGRTPKEVISNVLHTAKFDFGFVTRYRIVEKRKVKLNGLSDSYTVVLLDTDLGRMIALLQETPANGSEGTHWWLRIYDTSPQVNRIY